MSAIAAMVASVEAAGDSPARRDAEQMTEAMVRAAASRADEAPSSRSVGFGPVASVAAAARTMAGEHALLACSSSACLAADASIVRRAELRRALADAHVPLPDAADDAQLLLAAWHAWGEGMVRRVEGDVALVIWDAERRVLVAWRDFVGRRPLHWMEARGSLLVGSTPGVVLANSQAPRKLNREAIAAAAGALFEHPDETAWQGVRVLPPGHLLTWKPGETPLVRRVWEPPVFERDTGVPFAEAREELRRLLADATAERMDQSRSTAIWLSGGWDSPAVYAAARQAGSGGVVPVSMSYPVGDRGREDEIIASITSHFGDEASWASVEDAPLVSLDPLREAEVDDEPFVHPYRQWNQRLAEVTRAAGAVVALDGAGGDQLFGITPVFLADLIRRGRIGEARRAARSHGAVTGNGRQAFMGWWRWGIRPLLPPWSLRVAGVLRGGRAPLGHLQRAVPEWLPQRGPLGAALRERARGWAPSRGQSLGAAETRWYLTSPYAGRILAAQSAAALEAGVILRSPLLDERLIQLAATRPRVERAGGGETKRLLRAAVSEWLPAEVLARRTSRTGLSTDYFRRELRMSLPRLLELAGDMEALGGLGVADPKKVRAATEAWLSGRADDESALALLCTLRTELWVRNRLRGAG